MSSSPPTGTSQPVTRALTLALRDGQAVQLKIAGSSMSPWLRSGDLITVSPINDPRIQIGTVVTVARDERWMMVHRVIAYRPGGYLTRGDLVPHADGFIEQKDILGTVSSAHRGARKLRFGIGPEKLVLAVLSRIGLLYPALEMVHRLARGLRAS